MRTPATFRYVLWGALSVFVVSTQASGQKMRVLIDGGDSASKRPESGTPSSKADGMRKVQADLAARDPLAFIMKHDSQLTLTAGQRDSVKSLSKQMDNEEKPILKELQKVMSDAARSTSGAALPPAAVDLILRLNEVQGSYAAKAKAQLNESQQHLSDSLYTVHLAEVKEKAGSGGGRGSD